MLGMREYTRLKHDQIICPVCDEGILTPSIYEDWFDNIPPMLGIDKIRVCNLEYHVCDSCGAEPILADQIVRNHEKVKEARNGTI